MGSDPQSAEEAVELFLERRRAGEAPDPAAFAAAHPGLEPDLSLALEALVALERATETDGDPILSVPDQVGPYRVLRGIGRGGMGVVFEAIEEALGRRVALKVLPPELVASPSARKRFRREAELAARLDHSGIATIYGAGVEGERPWIAMRFVEGETLARRIARARADGSSKGREAALGVARLVARVARALHAAHEQGVVHRDIKPSNVIVQPDGTPVLLDFGLAIEEDSDGRSLTRTGEAPGTPAYLAPETVAGEIARPDAQSDVYALGVTLYECLASKRPYDAPTRAALYREILAGAPPALRSSNSSVPRDLAVVAATAMERDRARRYRSADAFADDLEACAAGRPIAARPVPLYGRMLRWARREPRLALAIAAAIVIAIAGFTWVSMAKSDAEANGRIATQRADDVLSLSAIQDLKELEDRADALWPADPEHVEKYAAWLADARLLVEGRPADPAKGVKKRAGLAEHKAKLAEIRARAKERKEATTYEFDDGEDRWWHAQLSQLVSDLETFTDEDRGGLDSSGISERHGWGIMKRAAFASTVLERSVEGPEAKRRWEEAITAIAASGKYGGLKLEPQLGLVPISADPQSGLWEFAHLQTGEPAEREVDGKLILKEETGLVFVLIPGGTFRMGAQRTDPSGPHYEPQANGDEAPVHDVTLSPYFLSKYEMTQGQWQRFTGGNPSSYGPGLVSGGHRHDLLHPVEQVSWAQCAEVTERLGLALASEAQWEYGCRAGTDTPWWSGAERESLRDRVNLADQTAAQGGAPWPSVQDWPDVEDGWVLHAAIGSFAANSFGLHEVLGNVAEWCLDGYDQYFYASSPEMDPIAPLTSSKNRVFRGGGFDEPASGLRAAARAVGPAEYQAYALGLRPARAITSSTSPRPSASR
ncbi:MAG TPA: bifunctional serine/threonine-protein kinase/formylglycine-generating enzyme family protein [Planctomycetota bacterium]|jgi:formylglycine-generating enzyme required for sulfatase activity|nr:bifunctional serine/threonine-protein kinase/formylglycine-generating enzyme family protein [Planctomycetota bacterium]